MKLFGLFLCLQSALMLHAQPEFKFRGLKMFVHDIEKAAEFYQELGFDLNADGSMSIQGSWPIQFEEAANDTEPSYPRYSRTGLALQTFKLLPMIDQFRKSGIKLYDSLLARNGVGLSIPFQDPSGNAINLIEVQIRDIASFQGVKLYNTGITISDMDEAIAFYQDLLGFEDWSRNYLPAALPLKHSDGSFAFMIHYQEGLKPNDFSFGEKPHLSIMLSVADMQKTKSYLKQKEVKFQLRKENVIIRDPEGNFLEIFESKG